jgi:hypothetical protein
MKLATVLFSVSLIAGCASTDEPRTTAPGDGNRVNLAATAGEAVDRLLNSMNPSLKPHTTVLVASFADLNDLTVTTKLGRLIAEESAEHLIQSGYSVPEVRLTNTLHIREDGEYMLSHEIDDLRAKYGLEANVVLCGTVTSVGGTTYVNFRLIRLGDGIAIAASDLELADSIADR